ncbi:MAG TPA: NAD-dependent epimerase/dehydratase family protein [Cyclobacteriaceae bacterium]
MVAVTGANGLVGSFVVRKLLEAREPFIALKRETSDASLLKDIGDNIEWRNADILDAESLNEALQGAGAVIHCAGLISYRRSDKNRLYEVNVLGTRNVVNSCISNNIGRVIHISSVAAIGRNKNISQVDENGKWAPGPLNTNYGESKYLAELEVMRGREEGLDVVIVNPSVVLGPGTPDRSSTRIFQYVWRERRFYTPGQVNYVSVRDVADIAYSLLYSGSSGERFIASAGVVPYRALLEEIALHFQKRPPSIRLNSGMLTLLAWMEKIRSGITGTEPLITRESLRSIRSSVYFRNDKVKKELNFQFQSIEETLKWCCESYVRHLNGKK